MATPARALAKTSRADRSAALSPYTRADVAAAIDSFEAAAGGRKALVAALVGNETDPELAYVLHLLADPVSDGRPLAEVCRAGGVSLGELIHAFKAGAFAVPLVAAVRAIAQQMPSVVSDVMKKGAPYLDTCGSCRGTTSVPDPDHDDEETDAPLVPCETCGATGQVRIAPTVEQQKLALSLTPLARTAAPAVVVDNRSVNVHDASPGGFAKILAMADRVLHQQSPTVIDAEPVADEDFDVE